MAKRLVDDGTLIGKTESEVIQMLGAPDWGRSRSEGSLNYDLDTDRGIFGNIDPWVLIISFDEHGKVTKCIVRVT